MTRDLSRDLFDLISRDQVFGSRLVKLIHKTKGEVVPFVLSFKSNQSVLEWVISQFEEILDLDRPSSPLEKRDYAFDVIRVDRCLHAFNNVQHQKGMKYLMFFRVQHPEVSGVFGTMTGRQVNNLTKTVAGKFSHFVGPRCVWVEDMRPTNIENRYYEHRVIERSALERKASRSPWFDAVMENNGVISDLKKKEIVELLKSFQWDSYVPIIEESDISSHMMKWKSGSNQQQTDLFLQQSGLFLRTTEDEDDT